MDKNELEKFKIIKEIREHSENGTSATYYILKKERKIFFISLLSLIILGGGLFYWNSIRPSQIKKECASRANNESQEYFGNGRWELNENVYPIKYKRCLGENGM